MPNIKSAKKRVKVIKVKTLQNKMHTTALKTEIKKFDAAVASGDKEAAQVAYKAAVKKINVSSGLVCCLRTPRLTRRASSPKRSTLWRKMRTEVGREESPWEVGDPLS